MTILHAIQEQQVMYYQNADLLYDRLLEQQEEFDKELTKYSVLEGYRVLIESQDHPEHRLKAIQGCIQQLLPEVIPSVANETYGDIEALENVIYDTLKKGAIGIYNKIRALLKSIFRTIHRYITSIGVDLTKSIKEAGVIHNKLMNGLETTNTAWNRESSNSDIAKYKIKSYEAIKADVDAYNIIHNGMFNSKITMLTDIKEAIYAIIGPDSGEDFPEMEATIKKDLGEEALTHIGTNIYSKDTQFAIGSTVELQYKIYRIASNPLKTPRTITREEVVKGVFAVTSLSKRIIDTVIKRMDYAYDALDDLLAKSNTNELDDHTLNLLQTLPVVLQKVTLFMIKDLNFNAAETVRLGRIYVA